MKVALYSPYIPESGGGGERYLLSIAEAAAAVAETVLLVPENKVAATKQSLERYGKTFGLDLTALKVEATGIGTSRSPLSTFWETHHFDLLFAMTDGSFFWSGAKQSYLIMQVPWTRKLSLVERFKLRSWNQVLVYSRFVARVLKKSWELDNLKVVEPYVDINDFRPGKKEPIILNVGRFFAHTHGNSKRQDVLIETFKKLYDSDKAKGYSLVLLGNVDPGEDSQAYVRELKEQAKGYPITIVNDVSYDKLRDYYARASLYWHAAGFEVDQKTNPENTEHFGITTLEAMASGCIPLVVPKGGQKEIVDNDRFFWETSEELLRKTVKLANLSAADRASVGAQMKRRASAYDKAGFQSKIKRLLKYA